MNNALTYLTTQKIKNSVLEFVKKPVRLIYIVVLIALLGLTFLRPVDSEAESQAMEGLYALVFAFYTFMFASIMVSGFSRGGAMFAMSDVNFLFPSPLRPQRILFYALFKQMGLSFLMGFFLLFQYSWLNSAFGISVSGLILIIVGYALSLFMSQMLAMVLYSYTSNNPKLKKLLKTIFWGFFALLAAGAGASVLPFAGTSNTGGILSALIDYANNMYVTLFPVSGWIAGLVSAVFRLDLLYILLYLSIIFICLLVLIILASRSGQGYYEDVIKSAEVLQSAITAKKSGQIAEVVPEKVKVGKTGIGKGIGASSIFYKHMLENRRSGIFMISNMSLIFAGGIIFFSLFMREAGITAVFVMATYMQIFSVALGRFTKELLKPYIYLIPQNPLKKLFYANLEPLISSSVEAAIIFVPVGFIVSAHPADVIFCILARITFTFVFLNAGIAIDRIFGSSIPKTITFVLYFVIIMLMAAPGIILGVVLSFMEMFIITEISTVLISMTVVNIPVSLLVMFLCQNVLRYADTNNN